MDTFADILDVRRDRHTLSVRLVDEILVRWRPLIDLCYESGGRWPINPFESNSVKKLANRLRQSTNWTVSDCGPPPPRWIARPHKAIVGVWLYHETLTLCNTMHWECASAFTRHS